MQSMNSEYGSPYLAVCHATFKEKYWAERHFAHMHWMAKLNFQQSLLQSSVSHDPSEIILIYWFAEEKKLLKKQKLSILKTVPLIIFEETMLSCTNEEPIILKKNEKYL